MRPFPFDATYVINLDRSPERWLTAQQTAAAAGIPRLIRMPGVDGQALNEDSVGTLQAEGRLAADLSGFDANCRNGEIGCGLSHVNVLRDIVAQRWRSALIIEDDVQLAGNATTWRTRLDAAYADLPPDWELWYLFRCLDVRHRTVRLTRRTVVPWAPLSGAAYAVTQRGAQILLDAVTPLSQAVDMRYMDVVKARQIRAFAASPMLLDATLGTHHSTIRSDAPIYPWMQNGVTRPPEYWPAHYLRYAGDPPPFPANLAEWWHRGRLRLRQFLRPRESAR